TEQPAERMAEIEAEIKRVLGNVRSAVEDWQPMRNELQATVAELSFPPAKIAPGEVMETRDFLSWLYDNHFTLLGFRDYDYVVQGKRLTPVSSRPGLGVLRDPQFEVFKDFKDLSSITPEIRSFLSRPDLLMVTKSNPRSTVHRPVHMDVIGIKRFDPSGKVVGQRIFVGLFTSSAYSRSPREIPLLRRKLATALTRAGFSPTSHDGKALAHILETFPRDELFQVSEQHLLQTALGILHLQDRQRVALFIRRDAFERFLSCLVYVPRDQYTTGLRARVQAVLERELSGTQSSFYTQLDDSPLARVHFIIRTTPGKIPAYDAAAIEGQLEEIARSWADRLHQALFHGHGEGKAEELFRRYRAAFPSGYQERTSAAAAVADIEKAEQALKTNGLALSLHRGSGKDPARIGLKLFNVGQPIPLSDVLPVLEHTGLRVINEIPDEVVAGAGTGQETQTVFIHDFGLHAKDGKPVDIAAIEATFAEALGNVWRGVAESDGFNALVLRAGLGWRDVVVLRALAKYLRQTGIAFSQTYMEETLFRNPALAILVVELFRARFDPAAQGKAAKRVGEIKAEIELALDRVTSADEDRIMRRFVNVVDAMLRTNFYQKAADGGPKPYISFKLDSKAVDDLPQPRPLREIFVYSPRVEGIHLRFGLVARGGLRWSDRREDFRTEILGLVKAQHVKNAVIVPVGSKGGFVVKQPPAGADREAMLKEGIACYRDFIRGLLDLTDNLKGTSVVPPPDVVRHDGDDPYLVVAADKGTATFSDIANGVSLEYDFWLGDAFASGGSAGYDHKKMGITARGAWESVKRHFREIGRDIQSEDFSVIGVGDMSGDVFGNGMLRSQHIRLQAAFNHLHIFIDPDPDPKASFAERDRLFALPRSSWADYNPKLISKGGGVYERTAKSIALSPEARKALGIAPATVTPNELIRLLLKAKTDLLWFGGIGTYIKETDESDAQVGDRTNDFVRVNANEVGAQVVGEGANLGVTQRGRIQYALNGGRINQDSIDNS
ncbi:MAG: NAD-glutamate dehydrogenase, partial [Rhodospirillales bacterium]|nr:NAD-glutamate dehydrogenase [Rhodospirillales bacterium]